MKTVIKILAILITGACIAAAVLYLPLGAGAADTSAPPSSGEAGGVVINEVMSVNKGIFPDNNGKSSDWVEIYNTTDRDINLMNCALSDSETEVQKWPFPNIALKAHGYMIIFLSGETSYDLNEGVIHCSFKLSSQGEKLVMTGGAGKVIDSVDIPALPENVSYGLMGGKWQQMGFITPGYENSEEGYQAFKGGMTAEDSPLMINEVMTSNAMTIADDTGAYTDWVEIINISDKDAALKGYGLSDDPGNALKWRFPDITLKAGESIIVFCSGIDTPYAGEGSLYAGFKLSSFNAVVTLSDTRGRTLDSVPIGGMSSDWSYARSVQNGAAGEWHTTNLPTPGYPNTELGFAAFMEGNKLALGDIVISEVLSSNNKIDTDESGKSDFIEIENRGGSAVSLNGYGLTDNASNPAKFRFPDITLQPGQQIIVAASGTENKDSQSLSAAFKLSRLGSTVALFDSKDKLLDKCFIGELPQNISVGREAGAAEFAYFETPTPGKQNGDGKEGISANVQFSKQAGIYEETIKVELYSSEGCDIYYTTEKGNTPTQSSTKYTGPISLSKTTVIRAKAFKDGCITSGTTTSTYFINPPHTLPLISIVTDDSNLFDPNTGIYVRGPNAQLIEGHTEHYQVANYLQEGKESERPASFEVFDESGKRVFDQNVAIRIQGGFSRDNQQKSLAILARSQYGPGTMDYKFFENLPITEYSSLVLRNGGQDQWYAKIKEAVVLSLVEGKTNVLTQAYKTYVVYLNGEYWGVYFLQEKRNEDFIARHESVSDPDSINLLYGSGLKYVINGTNEDYKELYNYITSHDMSKKENFDYLAERYDTDSFMDLMVNQIYMANSDYYNLEFYQAPEGKWKQIFYDFCWTFREPEHKTLTYRMDPDNGGSTMFNALLKYGPWKQAFIERFAWAMKNIYSTERMLGVIDEVSGSVASEMPAERSKFTDVKAKDWNAQVERLRTFARQRPEEMRKQFKSYFKLSDDQMKSLFG